MNESDKHNYGESLKIDKYYLTQYAPHQRIYNFSISTFISGGNLKLNVGFGGFIHETNTFSLETNRTPDAEVLLHDQIIDANYGKKTVIGGYQDAAERRGFKLLPTAYVRFIHGGLIHRDVYEHYRELILREVNRAGEFDGFLLALHGAMTAEEPYLDAEGEFLKTLRETIGTECPIVCTYDFHANMTDLMVSIAYPVGYNTNPHIDGYERGIESAETLLRMMKGEIHPVTARKRVPIIGPNLGMSTWSHDPKVEAKLPMADLNRLREDVERIKGVLNATIYGGYSYSDIPEPGVSIVVSTDGDRKLAEDLSKKLARATWEIRDEFLEIRPTYPVDVAVKKAMEAEDTPVLLVDVGDDPGSACPADSPVILEALIRLGVSDAAVTIRDPEAVEKAISTGIRKEIELEIGGKIDSRFYKPIKIRGRVKTIDDGIYMITGPTHGGWGREVKRESWSEADVAVRAVIRTEKRIDIVLSKHTTGKDRDFFKSIGVDPEGKRMIVVKSTQAHRASFDPIVKETIEVDSPGISTPSFHRLPYRNIKRPVWPMDRDMSWTP